MKKLLIPLLITASITTAYAGNFHGEDHRQPHKLTHLFDRIDDLSDKQKAALEKITPPSKDKNERGHGPKLIKDLDPSAADYQTKLDDIAIKVAEQAKARFLEHAAMHAKIHEILTEEQRKKLQEGKRCDSKR